MREIKFRAWDKSDNKFIHNIYPATNGDVAGEYNGRFCLRLPAERVIIEQFTGLKDKNGNEIYEGDKIKGGKLGEVCTVQWDEHCGRWIAYSDKYKVLGHKFKMYEVIGNIH